MDHLAEIMDALSAGHQVRGVMYGRNVLYPQKADPRQVASAIGKLVHGKMDPEGALEKLKKELNL
jgi:DhnA family fructose-bisphosphate aldolase class Ia